MREYIRVLWKRDFPDDPIEMHYEVLPDRAVPRMVEIFADGRAEADMVAWQSSPFQGRSLVEGDMPTAAAIRERTAVESPGDFEVFESTQDEFEIAFQAATPRLGRDGANQ